MSLKPPQLETLRTSRWPGPIMASGLNSPTSSTPQVLQVPAIRRVVTMPRLPGGGRSWCFAASLCCFSVLPLWPAWPVALLDDADKQMVDHVSRQGHHPVGNILPFLKPAHPSRPLLSPLPLTPSPPCDTQTPPPAVNRTTPLVRSHRSLQGHLAPAHDDPCCITLLRPRLRLDTRLPCPIHRIVARVLASRASLPSRDHLVFSPSPLTILFAGPASCSSTLFLRPWPPKTCPSRHHPHCLLFVSSSP